MPSLRLLSLSATGREDGGGGKQVFRLSPEQRRDEAVTKRLEARKRLTIQVLDDATEFVPQLAERAWGLGKGPARVLVYCDRREDAVKVKGEIDKRVTREEYNPVSELLVGGRRVFERAALSEWLEKHGFFGDAGGPPEQPTFLIATSAGEVGVDLDADHMVCDLVEWERMVQRLGRVNRRGNGEARVEVIATSRSKETTEDWKERLARLRKPLDGLRYVAMDDERDASPSAILDLRKRAEKDPDLRDAIDAATTPVPLRPALTRAIVDAWSLTSLRPPYGTTRRYPALVAWLGGRPTAANYGRLAQVSACPWGRITGNDE